jgi:hypothetical protein
MWSHKVQDQTNPVLFFPKLNLLANTIVLSECCYIHKKLNKYLWSYYFLHRLANVPVSLAARAIIGMMAENISARGNHLRKKATLP